jgi:hypothetical protein
LRSVRGRVSDYILHKLVTADGSGESVVQGDFVVGNFLPGDRPWWRAYRWWPVLVALVLTVALTASGQNWFASSGQSGTPGTPATSPAQQFADAAMAAFSGSTTVAIPNPAATPDQRAAGLPPDPVAGLTSVTPAGPVQQVLPDGLGTAQRTSSGSVVYPDHGAGFDFLAENTGTGTRTVARINSPTGVRMVTTFVRTPVDTVMLAHTNGYLTINRATPTADTVGMFAPAETRDAAGKLVPSSYVARQLRPGLYQLSEVIDPRPDTQWPVYVDPPLHVGGGALPAGLFDSITSTVSSAASAVGNAVSSAASATVSGAKAVGTFVKNNPMETAVIVAGAAVAVTGVGGPAGAAAIAAAVANVSAAGLQIAAEAMPDNQTLGVISTAANVATMFTPTGAAKKIAEEGAELVAKQALTHTDDIVDAAKAVPNPAQLREEIAAAGTTGKPPLPGVETPKAPNAPPAAVKGPEPASTPLGERAPCAGQSFSPDTMVLLADGTKRPIAELKAGDRVWSTDPETGRTSGQLVQAVLVDHDTDLLDLTITNPADVASVVHTTAKHPFYRTAGAKTSSSEVAELAATTGTTTRSGATWVDAKDLRSGDRLATPFRDSVAHVAASTPVPGMADMWDLTVENTHTFYVATLTAAVLVHNCPMPGAAPHGPEEPKGGVYVIRDASGTVRYSGKASDLERRLYEQAGPKGKLQPGDSIQQYRSDSPAVRSGVEQRFIDRHGTLYNERTNPDGRNLIRGVAESNPRAGEYRDAANDYLSRMHKEPEITQLPERVQQRLNQQERSRAAADQQRSEATNSAHAANESHRGSQGGSSASSHQEGKSSKGGRQKSKPKRRKSKPNHPHR